MDQEELPEIVPEIAGRPTDNSERVMLSFQDESNKMQQLTLADKTSTCHHAFDDDSAEGLKDISILHHSLPITTLKLLEGIVLVASEGPSILMKMAYFDECSFRRYQIFSSELVISGMEFVNYPVLECGANPVHWHKRSDKPYDYIYVGFVWAGSVGTIVRLTRSCKGVLKLLETSTNDEMTMDYIPVAAKWLEGGNILILLSVLNYAVIYERVEEKGATGKYTILKELARINCGKSETLFSGTISGSSKEDVRIFAGTVFNGICVWDIRDKQGIIRHELKCHDGIVFSVEYYDNQKVLLSTSDDRTVAVWKFSGHEEVETVELMHRFYGHDARVWKAVMVRGYVISVGESSDVRVNKLQSGEEHKSWRAHDGSPIFTCVYDDDVDILYTAGMEGSIRKWPKWWYRLKPRILPYDSIPFDPDTDDKSRIQGSGRWSKNKDFPKMVVLLDINHTLAAMESGRVLVITWEGKQFDLLRDSRCEGYHIIKLSPDHKVLAVAGKEGHFYTAEIVFSENQSSKSTVIYARKLFMTKLSWHILNMIWLDVSRLLIICLNRAVAVFFEENDKGERSDANLIQIFNLNIQRPGVPTAVEINGKHIILGDEIGTLHLFRYHKTNEEIQKLENVHKDRVTHLLYQNSKLYSSGRDGTVKTFSVQVNVNDDLQVNIIPLASYSVMFDWITGIYSNMGSLLICGFQKEDFIVHSFDEKRTLAKVSCGGGGNRKWSFKYGHGSNGSLDASFAFIKDKEIFYTFLPMTGYLNVIMKEGLHSRTVNCAVQLPNPNDTENVNYITGSEDGTIKWFQWNKLNHKILPVKIMENHVSSVRSAWKITTGTNQTFIFTGGGRSQLCIYKLDLDGGSVDLLKEITLVKTSFKQTEGDVRIMDAAVIESENNELICFGACSDGFVRVLKFNTQTYKFNIYCTLTGNAHAVMKIQVLNSNYFSPGVILICGVTSNGYLLLWNWSMCSNFLKVKHETKFIPEISSDYVKLLRRTAFLSMQTCSCNEKDSSMYLIVCGGDDCSVGAWSLEITKNDDELSYTVKEKWARDFSQRGAIVGVSIGDDLIYTISNDQIVGFWNFNGKLEKQTYAGVTDCQGFVVDENNRCALCFGKGISWIPI